MIVGKLYLVGFALILLGLALVMGGSAGQSNISTGGFILIGPFPIVFGTGQDSVLLAALSVAVGIIMVLLVSAFALRARRGAVSGAEQQDKT